MGSLNVPVGTDPDGDTQLDMLEDEAAQEAFEAVVEDARAPILQAALDRLQSSERDAIHAVFYNGEPKGTQHNALKRALRKLRNDYRLTQALEGYVTPIWQHTTLTAFKRDMTSSVERAAIRREALLERL